MRNRHSHHPPFQSTRYIFYHIKEKGRRISAVHIVHSARLKMHRILYGRQIMQQPFTGEQSLL